MEDREPYITGGRKMREPKYKTWNKYHKKMYSVYEINFDHSIAKLRDEDIESTHTCGFVDLEFLQYTGLKDKNGKEIYESDLIKVLCYDGKSYNEFTVYYDPFSCCYVPNFGRLESSDIEVIGNIYENPEYLKNKVDKEGTNVL